MSKLALNTLHLYNCPPRASSGCKFAKYRYPATARRHSQRNRNQRLLWCASSCASEIYSVQSPSLRYFCPRSLSQSKNWPLGLTTSLSVGCRPLGVSSSSVSASAQLYAASGTDFTSMHGIVSGCPSSPLYLCTAVCGYRPRTATTQHAYQW